MQRAPFGTWQSDISGDYLASRSIRMGETQWCDGELFWIESRPEEQGRQTVVCLTPGEQPRGLLPAPWDARSRVHEYGGGHYRASRDFVFFIQATDQQIYALNRHTNEVKALTAETECRFADPYYHAPSQTLYAICEKHQHGDQQPANHLVQIKLNASWPAALELIEGDHDFVSNPRVSPCGKWLSYLTWDHPQMPWDGGQVWVRHLNADRIGPAAAVAGGEEESVFEPQWSPTGDLYWVSDRSNWWNLQRLPAPMITRVADQQHHQHIENVLPMEAEFATPQWVFGMSTYGFPDDTTILATFSQNGTWQLAQLTRAGAQWRLDLVATPCNSIAHVSACDGQGAFIGATPYHPSAVHVVANSDVKAVTYLEETLDRADVSVAQPIEFPCKQPDQKAYGFFYAPANSQFTAPENTLPPLIVVGHGGPTGACDPSFAYKIQYWTNRGFAVLDVNYRGSTGYGRRFRQLLQKQWGVADVEDLCSAAEFAVAQGWVNPQQLIIRGSSAGGLTVLSALTDRNTFHAGVSLYGVADLELLARDTHKFESRYLDGLIGPYPEEKEVYIQRSPIHKVTQIDCPILVFQGLQDKVVPPNQAELLVESVRARGVPVAYVTYAQEGHGFRSADAISHQVNTELAFYQTIFQLGETKETADGVQKLNASV